MCIIKLTRVYISIKICVLELAPKPHPLPKLTFCTTELAPVSTCIFIYMCRPVLIARIILLVIKVISYRRVISLVLRTLCNTGFHSVCAQCVCVCVFARLRGLIQKFVCLRCWRKQGHLYMNLKCNVLTI